MQDNSYYIKLIKSHYSSDYIYLKKKYKKSFKEIYNILHHQELSILKLQSIILDYEDKNKEDILIFIFAKDKSLYKSFIKNLFKIETSKPINAVLYNSAVNFLNKIENNF